MKTFTSKRGMVVTLSDEQYDKQLEAWGPDRVREMILTKAARCLGHRQILPELIARYPLNEADQRRVTMAAIVIRKEELILEQLEEMGYGEYVVRRAMGGHMPPSWNRIWEQAVASLGGRHPVILPPDTEPEIARRIWEHVDRLDDRWIPEITERELELARGELGFVTKQDIEWARQHASLDWNIQPAPEAIAMEEAV